MRSVHAFALLMAVSLMGCVEPEREGLGEALVSARVAPIDVGRMADGLAVGRSVTIALPDAGEVELVVRSVMELWPGVTTFTGYVAGDASSDATFSIEAGRLVGSIRKGPHAWLVEPHASGLHLVRMIDRTSLPQSEPAMAPSLARVRATSGGVEPGRVTSATNANGNVRVLMVFASDIWDPHSHAANIVAAFNQSLAASEVSSNNGLTLAGVITVASDFNDQSKVDIRAAMNARTGPFANLEAAMNTHAADIALLLVSEDLQAPDPSGFGRVGGLANISDPANPFALSTISYALGDLTALHELGHVFGGHHENTPAAGIAQPVVDVDGEWMTVMGAYSGNCVFRGLQNRTCIRLGRWSNPAHTYDGVALGRVADADMESHLEGTMPGVSNWRAEPQPPNPAVLTSPPPGSTLPGASVTFAWTTGSGVSQYYLYVGSSHGGYDLYAAGQGLATSTTVWGLPTDGRTLYVRLWSYTSLGWQARDYTYLANTSCAAQPGSHGQMWTTVSVNAQYAFHDGWCTVGTSLPQQCWDGTYYYYQSLQSSYCVSGGSTGSCYDGDAWWWVTCNALIECVYECNGTCLPWRC